MKVFLISIFILLVSNVNAQQEYVNQNVKSVKILPYDVDFGYPMSGLNDVLELKFDVLDDNYQSLRYTIRHCDSDFNVDDLTFGEYAEGFDNSTIKDFKTSFNTLTQFTHYTLSIPNNDVKLTISGNYIITVYDGDYYELPEDKENILLEKRFMVYESDDNLSISAQIAQPFLPEFHNCCQQISLQFNNANYKIFNPSKYLKVYVMQNNDYGTRRALPISGFQNNEILYNGNNEQNVFLGGNEFDFIDAKDVHFRALGIDAILYRNGRYHYVTTPLRYDCAYRAVEDLNGDYYIKNDRAYNFDLESDYVDITFRFDYDPFTDYKIYLYGELTYWSRDTLSQLTWNEESRLWETTITLKQGLYNYKYVIKDDSNQIVDFSSGNNFNTKNNYLVTLYTTLPSNRGDRLLMVKILDK